MIPERRIWNFLKTNRKPMIWFNLKKRSFCLSGIILISVFISGCGLFSDADQKYYFSDTPQPDDLEYEYIALASEIHSVKPCYLIHPNSLRKGAFNAVGNQVTLLQSQCFHSVAGISGDPSPCEEVRSASTLFLSGAQFDKESCRRSASAEAGFSYNLDVPEIVTLAGYTEEEIDAYLVSEGRFSTDEVAKSYRLDNSSVYWGEVRRNLLHSLEFFERIDQLPPFDQNPDTAKMSNLTWSPRPQRQWTSPEQRTQSTPEIKIPAQSQD